MADRDATTTTTATTTHSTLSSLTSELTNGNNTLPNKPREERSYKDFFPNLNIKEPLAIVDVQVNDTTTHTTSTMTAEQQPKAMSDQTVPTVDTPPLANGSSLSDTESSSTAAAVSTMDDTEQPAVERDHHHHLVDHQKEGDIYQALSTRPQAGVNNDIVNLDLLPKPAFQIVDVDTTHDSTNDMDQDVDVDGEETEKTIVGFQRPENHYIRYIEPSEADLMNTIEYDMDEQDEAWLRMLNEERAKDNLGQVSCDLFEAVIDQLEKEWFDLVKNLPKQLADEPALPEDSACAICDDTECENSNAIVFCDGCNLAVHQDCYGIPYIPEGQWLCRKCLVSPENPVSCIFCPNEGGAFKQTNTNKWGHLLCAIWIPEVGLSNSVYMEPIDNIENVPKSRWKLQCYICRRKHGACIQCDNKHCFVAFHVTCARWARLCMRMKSHSTHYDGVVFKAYCDKHTPRDYKENVNVEQSVTNAQAYFAAVNRRNKSNQNALARQQQRLEEHMRNGSSELDMDDGKKKRRKSSSGSGASDNTAAVTQLLPSSKAARAHQHHYSAGAPIAPEYIINKLENLKCVRQTPNLRKKSQFITSICRYWSLKRESRRGAPLLKRLHLEPWTASSSQHKQTEVEKAHKAKAMMNLRADLEKVRMLSEQVQKREKQKLERIRKQKAYLEMILFPVEYIMRPVVEQLIEADKKELFRYPVTPEVAPDYADIIETPMAFSDILERFANHEYSSIDQVERDIMLIWKNSMTYNKPETTFYRTAERLEKVATDMIQRAKGEYAGLELRRETGILAVDIHPEIFKYNMVRVPSPEEIAAEKARVEAEELARVENEEKQRQRAQQQEELENARLAREEARQKALAVKREKRAAAAEAKRIRQQREPPPEPKTRKAVAAAEAAAAAKAEAEAKELKIQKEKEKAQAATVAKDTSVKSESTVPKSKSKSNLRRRTRSMGTDGLIAPTPERLRKRNSNEARNLMWHSDAARADTREYKVDRKRKAPPGWQYLEDSDGEAPLSPPASKKVKSSHNGGFKPESPTCIEYDMIVWARVPGFPPHPAMIIDPSTIEMTRNIMSAKQAKDDYLVEFYKVPDRHKWGWVQEQNIHTLGKLQQDAEMLSLSRKKKNARRIKESREGYEQACKLLGLDPKPALDASVRKK
ncbi:hypothetical protein K492DRAFT_173932 [Lichtheimia hyalospora FSU 10163]|nr:hypothetical protein K492DRAFT_173932 [Lichtheimia hyalospora FSU 10163]